MVPVLREFWLKKPQPGSRSIEIYALLDSESVTGAYHFQLTPGNESVMEVRTCLYTRAAVEKLGIAPLTSMFLYGERSEERRVGKECVSTCRSRWSRYH